MIGRDVQTHRLAITEASHSGGSKPRSHALRPGLLIENVAMFIPFIMPCRLCQRGNILLREEARKLVAPLDILGNQDGVLRVLGKDLLEIWIVFALSHHMGQKRDLLLRKFSHDIIDVFDT